MKTVTIAQVIDILRDAVFDGPRYYGRQPRDESRVAMADLVIQPLVGLTGEVSEQHLIARIEAAERYAVYTPTPNWKYLHGRDLQVASDRWRAEKQARFVARLMDVARLYTSRALRDPALGMLDAMDTEVRP